MTEVRVQTLEYRDGDSWSPEYRVGAFKDGDTKNYDNCNFYWKTVVWKVGNARAYGNAHDRIFDANGGRFDDFHYRFREMDFDPEKHDIMEDG